MKTLKLIRQWLTVFGLCSKSKKSSYTIFVNWTIICLFIGFLMITLQYILTHFDDRANVLYAIMQFVTFVTVWTCYICFATKKTETFHIIEEFQLFADNYKKRFGSYGVYSDAEDKSHAITKWPPIIFFGAFYGVIIISVVNIIISDVIPGALQPETWYTFYKMTAPFNRTTVSGFIGYFIIQFILLHCYYAGLIPCFSFFVGVCNYLEASCLDLAEQFESIDNDIRLLAFKQIDLKLKLKWIVQIHMKIVEQFNLSARIFSGIIFFQLACGSAFISMTVFQLDLAWGTFDGNFFVVVCVFILSIMCIFPYCWYATNLSLKLQNIADDAYDSLWYTHPYEMQIFTKRIIAYAQIRRSYDGYHIFRCSLEIFMKIAKASASYYLMLKSF